MGESMKPTEVSIDTDMMLDALYDFQARGVVSDETPYYVRPFDNPLDASYGAVVWDRAKNEARWLWRHAVEKVTP